MDNQLKAQIDAKGLALQLGLELCGENMSVTSVCPLNALQDNSLTFTTQTKNLLEIHKKALVIASKRLNLNNGSVLLSDNPRLDFVKAMNLLDKNIGFCQNTTAPVIHPSAEIEQTVVIEPGVSIGANTVISHHVVIRRGTVIGRDCFIQPGAVLGEDGYGFEADSDGVHIKMKHLGGLIIGNHVLVGANTVICRGTLSNTTIGNHVKIDNLVHVAHNCQIADKAMIVAGAELSGGVAVGEGAWVAPNSCIRQKVRVGKGAMVGLGAVVVKDVLDFAVVAGNPAKPLIQK